MLHEGHNNWWLLRSVDSKWSSRRPQSWCKYGKSIFVGMVVSKDRIKAGSLLQLLQSSSLYQFRSQLYRILPPHCDTNYKNGTSLSKISWMVWRVPTVSLNEGVDKKGYKRIWACQRGVLQESGWSRSLVSASIIIESLVSGDHSSPVYVANPRQRPCLHRRM